MVMLLGKKKKKEDDGEGKEKVADSSAVAPLCLSTIWETRIVLLHLAWADNFTSH